MPINQCDYLIIFNYDYCAFEIKFKSDLIDRSTKRITDVKNMNTTDDNKKPKNIVVICAILNDDIKAYMIPIFSKLMCF